MNTDQPDSLTTFLQANALFGGLSDVQMPAVIALLKEESFAAGDLVVREGEHGDRIHFILSGTAEVVKHATPGIADDNSTARLVVLKPGAAFGEMSFIDTQPRSASVRTMEPVQTLSLANRDMHKLYRTHPEIFTMIILNLARELSRRLRQMDDRAASRTPVK
jgi:CRP/FNR family transcriptional regulator, cyclic AMP receptor protein